MEIPNFSEQLMVEKGWDGGKPVDVTERFVLDFGTSGIYVTQTANDVGGGVGVFNDRPAKDTTIDAMNKDLEGSGIVLELAAQQPDHGLKNFLAERAANDANLSTEQMRVE